MLISGEPGIGKTSLARELCSRARERHFDVAWGSCYEGEGAPHYWPWVLVVRDLVRLRGARAVREQMGGGASAIVSMVPSLAEVVGPAPAAPPLEDMVSARFRFNDAMAGFLARAADAAPLVMVLDDLHWADAPSLSLLSFLPRDLACSRMLVLATFREEDVQRGSPMENTLGELGREQSCERLALPALAREEVEHYLAEVWEGQPPAGLVEKVLAGSEGNAFFMAEAVRMLREEPGGGGPGGAIRVPVGVADVIRHRLRRLSAPCVRLLAAGAAVGREFGVAVVGRVLEECSEHAVLESLAEASGAGFVRCGEDGSGRWEFTHALVEKVLAEETPLADRPALHARIADALEAEYGARAGEHSRELVEHLERAGSLVSPARLAGYLARAGEQAQAVYAYEEARDCYKRAIELRRGSPDEAVLAELWFGLGKAQDALSDPEALPSIERSREAFERAGLVERAIEVAAWMPAGHLSAGGTNDWERQRTTCAQALAMVQSGSLRQAELLLKHAWLGGGTIDVGARRGQMEAALAIARGHGEARLEARILESLTLLAVDDLDSHRIERYAEEALEVARRTDDLHGQCRALRAICNRDQLLYAPRPAVVHNADALLLAARRLRNREVLMWACWARERVAWAAADWSLARALNAECQSLLPAGRPNPFLICNQAGFAYEAGEIEEGDRALEEAIGIARDEPSVSRVGASVAQYVCRFMLMTARSLHLEEARRLAEEAGRDPAVGSEGRDWVEQAMALLGVLEHDGQAASELYPVFAKRPRDPYRLWLSYIPGLLARTAGRMEDALLHLREGVSFCREGASMGNLRWHLFFLAETLLQRSCRGDREEAVTLLDELDALASRTGSVLVGRRARELREGMAAAPAPPMLPDGLTEREVEVLRLIARGYTNAEIGKKLFISPATVATHVHRMLEATGMANRTELTSYAIRNGLAQA